MNVLISVQARYSTIKYIALISVIILWNMFLIKKCTSACLLVNTAIIRTCIWRIQILSCARAIVQKSINTFILIHLGSLFAVRHVPNTINTLIVMLHLLVAMLHVIGN